MKLRIRNGSITKVLTLQDNVNYKIGEIKTCIREKLLTELNLSSSSNFNLSLNGKSSLGSDSLCIDEAGIVSGDLLKVIPGSGSVSPRSEQSPRSTTATARTNIATQENVRTEVGNNSRVLLLQDYKEGQPLPPTLTTFYQLDTVKGQSHALVVLLHNFMLESGFVCENNDLSHLSNALLSPVVSIEYSHPGTGPLIFTLTFNKLGKFLLLNGIVRPCENTDDQVISLHVKLDQHVHNFTTKPVNGRGVYKQVGKLSRLFQSEISHKALDSMRAELNLPPLHGILSLFPEILLRIGSYLDCPSLCALSQTCRSLSEIANDDLLWRPLYVRTFTSAPILTNSSWKDMFKKEFLRRRREERERREYEQEFSVIPPPIPSTPDVPLVMPYPGHPLGMIGGEHDLDPMYPYGPFSRGPRPHAPTFGPRRPRMPGFGNPLPGSRFDPMFPYGGGSFRPGRGGGMMDNDFSHRRLYDPFGRGGGFL